MYGYIVVADCVFCLTSGCLLFHLSSRRTSFLHNFVQHLYLSSCTKHLSLCESRSITSVHRVVS